LGLRWKVAGGFGLLILLASVIAVEGWRGVSSIGATFSEYRQTARENLFLAEVNRHVADIRLGVMKFRSTQDQAQIDRVNALIDEAVATSARDADALNINADTRARIQSVIEQISVYGDRFEEAVGRQAVRNEYVAKLNTTGPEMRKAITEIMKTAYEDGDAEAAYFAGRTQEYLMLARYYTQRFLVDNKPADIERVRKELASAKDQIAALDGTLQNADRRATMTKAAGLLQGYAASFETVAEAILARNAILITELDKLGPAVKGLVDQVVQDRVDLQNTLGPAAVAQIETSQGIVVTVSIVAVILGLATALFIARITILPIRKLTERMNEVAEGRTKFAVRTENSHDEIGRMWSALRVLRDAAEDSFKKAQMIEQLQVSVMVADPKRDCAVEYLNEAAERSLSGVSSHLKCGVDALTSHDVAAIHRDLAEDRDRMTQIASLPFKKRIAFGDDKVIDMQATAIKDRDGDHVGTMLSWEEVTETVRMTEDFEINVKAAINQVQSSFQQMTEQLGIITEKVARVRSQSTEGATAVTQASANVQTVATASEELSTSIREIASQVSRTTRMATDANRESASASTRAEDLSQASQRITEVVRTISDIAEQTNLLALNATIEAARAGDAGKGFAVVASEVKNLANQTAKSTEEVSAEVQSIQAMIEDVVASIKTVTDTINRIHEVFTSVATAVEQQEAATTEIARNIQEAATGTHLGVETIKEVEIASSDNAEAAQTLSTVAEQLAEANSMLESKSDAFLGQLKNVA
jgi:methyl-accepting chemotaxis protein